MRRRHRFGRARRVSKQIRRGVLLKHYEDRLDNIIRTIPFTQNIFDDPRVKRLMKARDKVLRIK